MKELIESLMRLDEIKADYAITKAMLKTRNSHTVLYKDIQSAVYATSLHKGRVEQNEKTVTFYKQYD